MGWVAVKPLTIKGERRNPGELVPEASTWHPNALRDTITAGRIREVPDAEIARRQGVPEPVEEPREAEDATPAWRTTERYQQRRRR